MQKCICWNGDPFQKEFTMNPFRDHFTFECPMELLQPEFPDFLFSSSRYSYNLNQF